MSVTSTFYLLAGELLADLHQASTPKPHVVKDKALFFARTRTVLEDALHPFLRAQGKRLSDFDGSGYAFSSLDQLLMDKGLDTLFSSVKLARPQAIGFFDDRIAASFLSGLRALKLTEEEVGRYLRGASGSTDAEAVAAIFAAARCLQEWLATVTPGQVGILSIEADEG